MAKNNKRNSKSNGKPKQQRVHATLPSRVRKANQALILSEHALGRTNEQIADKMNMTVAQVSHNLNIALQDMIRSYASPSPEQNYVRYATFQMGVIQRLQEAADSFMDDPNNKQYGALVSAIKAQSDVYDKILSKGIEFGIVQHKKADKDTLRLAPKDLRVTLRQEILSLESLLDEVDNHTNLHAMRERKQQASQRGIKLTRKMKRVEMSATGPVTAIPDWKYRTKVYTQDGAPVPKKDQSTQDKDTLALQQQVTSLKIELLKERGIPYVQTPAGKIIELTQPENATPQKPQPEQPQPEQQPASEQQQWLVKPQRSEQ